MALDETGRAVDHQHLDSRFGESGKGICAELVEALHARSWDLNVWTVDDPNEALRMRALGVLFGIRFWRALRMSSLLFRR